MSINEDKASGKACREACVLLCSYITSLYLINPNIIFKTYL